MRPKTKSLLDCITELDTDFALLTETWLQDEHLDKLKQDLSLGSGLGLEALNRKPGANGVAYGGVAVVWRESVGNLSRVTIKNPEAYEVIATAVSLKGHSRKLVLIACYIPPEYSRVRGNGALEFIENVVVELKRRFKDPYLVIGGDFNHWRIDEALGNFPGVKEIEIGPTRGSRSIDRLFVNVSRSVKQSGTFFPLETEEDELGLTKKSDHKIVFCKIALKRRKTYRWESYTYRHYNDASAEKFREWVVFHDWCAVLSAPDAESKAEAYQDTVIKAVEKCFPLRKVRRKDTDPPWLDKRTKKMIKDCGSLCNLNNRSSKTFSKPQPAKLL